MLRLVHDTRLLASTCDVQRHGATEKNVRWGWRQRRSLPRRARRRTKVASATQKCINTSDGVTGLPRFYPCKRGFVSTIADAWQQQADLSTVEQTRRGESCWQAMQHCNGGLHHALRSYVLRRLEGIQTGLLRLVWMEVPVCFEQLRTQGCQCSEINGLVSMLDLARVQDVVEHGSKATQLSESDCINSHVGTPLSAGRQQGKRMPFTTY
jgi:hypothetical protein